MRILVTGRGTSGSWQIRGEQLGRAIGATVLKSTSDVKGYDCALVVKRPVADTIYALRSAGIPWIWDILDAWPQPHGNMWDEHTAHAWLSEQLAFWRPYGVIAATQAMEDDLLRYFRGPILALPHHGRPGQEQNDIRREVVRVGYQGGLQYIERWSRLISVICKTRGLEWIQEAHSLANLDIVLAIRDISGYPAKKWKSNVKLANAQITGTPVVCSRESGYQETANDGVLWADNEVELQAALDVLRPQCTRRTMAAALLRDAIVLQDVAWTLRHWLEYNVAHA